MSKGVGPWGLEELRQSMKDTGGHVKECQDESLEDFKQV